VTATIPPNALATGIELETSDQLLRICEQTGRLVSLRSKSAPDQEFISINEATPAFTVQYLDAKREYRQLSSLDATPSITLDGDGDGDEQILTARFERVGGADLDVTLEVRAMTSEPFSRWSLTLDCRAELDVTDVQFPVVVCGYQLAGARGSEAAVWPLGCGMLMTDIRPNQLQPDHPHSWQFVPANTDTHHYPGYTFAQFLSYYNDRAGVYLACEDPAGRIKLFKPLHHRSGIRLGVSHVGDWPSHGARRLEYDTVLGTFVGDWMAAATLYRDWSLRQPWASRTLADRDDVPAWLRDGPPHMMVRIQGEIDDGPTEPNPGYIPYAKAIEPLDRLEQRLGSPILPVLMGWERPGPWIYPDCFPPAGGEAELRELSALIRERGWHLGTFCNGTRWVTAHHWSGYDGRDHFERQNGAATVCRLPDGRAWDEFWDATWRPSHPCCVAVEGTRDTAISFVETVVDLGFDWIQFFDQNVGACAFPCFADDHGHPAKPGLWMTEQLRGLLSCFREVSERNERPLIFSVEGPVNELLLQDFQVADIRTSPPGHRPLNTSLDGLIPLYHFLYHELILLHGGFGSAPDPHHLEIRTAYNFVLGEIVGAAMHDDGSLMNRDTDLWWAPRLPAVGDPEAILDLLAAATALRRDRGRDFLVTGRMQTPAAVDGAAVRAWEDDRRVHRIPAVFDAAWQAPDGRLAVALANWTDEAQQVTVSDARLGGRVLLTVADSDGQTSSELDASGESLALTLPIRSCALLEATEGEL
jgi:hypothetical protein